MTIMMVVRMILSRAMLSDDYDDRDHCHDDGGSSGAASMTSLPRADGRT